MKRIFTAIFMAILLFPFFAAAQKGVPAELASKRKAKISDVAYNLHFNIPADTAMPVEGTIDISFHYKPAHREDLAIDFRPGKNNVKKVMVNGKTCRPRIEDEHIYIPDALLKSGLDKVSVSFTASNRHLNRRPDFMYTLFVPDRARTAFPCFEQPDLKASYSLSLTIPEGWECVGNSPVIAEKAAGNMKTVSFAPTEPLSTYLFAFAAGEFQKMDWDNGDRKITAYYRETDPSKIVQLPWVMHEIEKSLTWQENFTGVKYPFAKYDIVVIPGFQFGGMEHTGATFYNDRRIFLGPNPTPDEELARSQLIAHETTHMWFGDYVTMAWFDDVWTKEVFANYFAAAITRLLLPQYDHDLAWLNTYTAPALAEDRSQGRTSIQQKLDNMNDAGLVYNNIIYNKAPIMMAKLVEFIGDDAFRNGIREYVKRYGYSNATWDDLIDCLQTHADFPVDNFSHVWVKEKGLPEISSQLADGWLICRQRDPLGNGNRWPQRFSVVVKAADTRFEVEVEMSQDADEMKFKIPDIMAEAIAKGERPVIYPNSDGRGYGLFTLPPSMLEALLEEMATKPNPGKLSPSGELATWMNLNENRLAGNIDDRSWSDALVAALRRANDPLLGSMLVGALGSVASDMEGEQRCALEKEMLKIAQDHSLKSCRTEMLRVLAAVGSEPGVCQALYDIWDSGTLPMLNENDFMSLAWQMAVRFPEKADSILSTQRSRLNNPDRISQFDYISEAVSADPEVRKKAFQSLLSANGRLVEPWALTKLSLLNHPLRQQEAVDYIYPGLEVLEEVQLTGDIFFPAGWCRSLLGNHRSVSARQELDRFMSAHPDMKQLLANKILNGAYSLTRATGGQDTTRK